MKRVLVIILLALPVFVIGQQFKLYIDGFKNSEDGKNYIVYEFENIKKEDMYNRVILYLTKTYKSAKDVISKVENEAITVNAIQPKQIYAKLNYYDLYYTLTISFKDYKIKIDAPTFECKTFAGDKPYRLTTSGSNGGMGSEVTIGLFKKNGEPSQEKAITQIEDFFNIVCQQIKDSASGNVDDNW